MKYEKVLYVILILFSANYVVASECKFNISFRFNSCQIDSFYSNNRQTIARLDSILRVPCDSILIIGYASPEGKVEYNNSLAERRALAVRDFILERFKYQGKIQVMSGGENWQGVTDSLKQNVYVPFGSDALRIIAREVNLQQRLSEIESLGQGRTIKYFTRHIYSSLRVAEVTIYLTQKDLSDESVTHEAVTNVQAELPEEVVSLPTPTLPEDESIKPTPVFHPLFILKTNTLYWAILLPNLEVEFRIMPRLTLNLDALYGWWSNSRQHKYWRIGTSGIELRYRLGKKQVPFRGHFLGAYYQLGKYDLMFRPTYGVQGEVFNSAGLTYGYQIGFNRRWGMEFSVGIGFMSTHYREYFWSAGEGHFDYKQTDRLSYFGPTKVKVSFFYTIGKSYKR